MKKLFIGLVFLFSMQSFASSNSYHTENSSSISNGYRKIATIEEKGIPRLINDGPPQFIEYETKQAKEIAEKTGWKLLIDSRTHSASTFTFYDQKGFSQEYKSLGFTLGKKEGGSSCVSLVNSLLAL